MRNKKKYYLCATKRCPDGEMVDTLVSGASASRHVGSSPILGTKKREEQIPLFFYARWATIFTFPPNLPLRKGGYKFSLKMVTFYMDKGTHSANNFINLYELLCGKEKNVVRWGLHITTSRISICQMVDSMKMIYALFTKE